MAHSHDQPQTFPNPAVKLFEEILASVETVAGIAEIYGAQTLVDLVYLLGILAKDEPKSELWIEQTHGSRIVEFLMTLPSGREFAAYVSTELEGHTTENPFGFALDPEART